MTLYRGTVPQALRKLKQQLSVGLAAVAGFSGLPCVLGGAAELMPVDSSVVDMGGVGLFPTVD